MPKARKPSSVTDSDVGDTEVMVMRFVELLKDEGVLKTLRYVCTRRRYRTSLIN